MQSNDGNGYQNASAAMVLAQFFRGLSNIGGG